MTTRPYAHRVKESVFNILRGHVQDARVLDLFAGVGTMGLEAISRGAAEVFRRLSITPGAKIPSIRITYGDTCIGGSVLLHGEEHHYASAVSLGFSDLA